MIIKVLDWNAWAPGLDSREKWLDWLKKPTSISSDEKAPVKFISPMIRRRLSPLGRAVVESIYPIYQSNCHQDTPLIFASRWGDIGLTEKLLNSFTQEGETSPTAFSTSVHNAIGGLFSIIFHHHGNICALSGGAANASAAIYEAMGLLTQYNEVIVTIYDDKSPPAFQAYHPRNFPFAFSLKLGRALTNEAGFKVSSSAIDSFVDTTDTLQELQALRFLLLDDHQWLQSNLHIGYLWEKVEQNSSIQ